LEVPPMVNNYGLDSFQVTGDEGNIPICIRKGD